jgi:hypothetical protein
MKRILILMTAVLLPMLAGAQAQINTKKIKIADFQEKVTKVVLTGNEFYDLALRDMIASGWTLSPYEFCTMEEFNTLKHNDDHYFLITADGKFKKENGPGLTFLTLVKGGKGAGTGISKMLEVVSIPIASAENPSGREFTFMPAFIDIIQDYTTAAMNNDLNGYLGLGSNTENLKDVLNMEIIFAEDDMSSEVDRAFMDLNFDSDMMMTDDDTVDDIMENATPDKIISYTVAPDEPESGSYCYKMLIHPESHKLYYFRKHRISKKYGPGFLQEDILRINNQRGR